MDNRCDTIRSNLISAEELERLMKIKYEFPLLLEYDADNFHLRYFGVQHTNCIEDPQLSAMQDSIITKKPSLIIVEGHISLSLHSRLEQKKKRLKSIQELSLKDNIEKHGESGFLAKLALENNIPIVSHEPDISSQMNFLLQSYSREEIFTHNILLSMFEAERNDIQKEDELNRFLNTKIAQFKIMTGWDDSFLTIDTVNTLCEKYYKKPIINDGSFFYSHRLCPVDHYPNNIFSQLGWELQKFRDAYIVNQIITEIFEFKDVLVVYGWAHPLTQRRALEVELKNALNNLAYVNMDVVNSKSSPHSIP